MVDKIPQHNHCHMCMKAIPVGETLCSEECRQKYASMMKKKKLIFLFLWAIVIVFLFVVIFFKAF